MQLEGIRYMHGSKVVHRDLKLGNLFLGKGDEVKIGDFGLACKIEYDGERKRTLCGTPNYIAPEVSHRPSHCLWKYSNDVELQAACSLLPLLLPQVLDGKNGHSYEVDVWSIGVIIYTCLFGKPPFETVGDNRCCSMLHVCVMRIVLIDVRLTV